MLLSGFSFAQYSTAWLFTVNLSYFSISYKVLPLSDTWSLTDAEIIEILPISLNSFSCKIHLLRYDLIEIRNTILLQLLY